MAFRKKARCTELLTETGTASAGDVDFFLENWGSEVYGADKDGHKIWCERVTTIKVRRAFTPDTLKHYARGLCA